MLERAATALAADRRLIRRLDALVEVGQEGRVGLTERELIERVGGHLETAFGSDDIRIALVTDGVPRWAGAGEREGEVVDDSWIQAAVERGEPIEESGPPVRFVVPLMGRDGALGAVEVVRLAEDFEERDRALLESLAAELAILVENTLPAARPAVPPVPAGRRRRLLPGRPEAGSARWAGR